jgi:pantothenate kinase
MTAPSRADHGALVSRARELAAHRRVLLGVTGAPGAGKSTLAEMLAAEVGESAVVVPMDGFHLHDDELARLGLSSRKGAPETFDVAGYVALLERLRAETSTVVYAPEFDRSRELTVAGAIAVRPSHRLVVTEGNYLLLDAPGWREVRPLLDEVWFVETDEAVRRPRLVQRHVDHGKPPEVARRWEETSDQPNALLVAGTREAADLVVTE